MLRSMYSAITALGLHQTYMDVVANNLANVNTTAYKAHRVDFKTQLSQLSSVGHAPTVAGVTPSLGGQNPIQVGLGTQLGAITKVFTQGSLRSTSRTTDLAIQGDGFFALDDGSPIHAYSRDGALDIGQDGALTHINTGLHVLGWQADPVTGLIDPTGPLTAITVPINSSIARATANATFNGNLDSRLPIAAPGNTLTSTMAVYDSLGNAHNITITYTHTGAGAWSWAATTTDPNITGFAGGAGAFTFDVDGQLTAGGTPAMSINYAAASGVNTPQAMTLDFADVTQLADTGNINQASQDGLAAGSLTGVSVVSDTGRVVAAYSNGMTRDIGQVAVANFVNPEGLLAAGENLYRPWLNSGDAQIGVAGSGGRGILTAGYLESSNVDLAQEFTNMITAQRGFQANSRVITTSDEMLQELVNMKR